MIGECSAITVRLTAYRAGDIVADSQKRRLNFLFAHFFALQRVGDGVVGF